MKTADMFASSLSFFLPSFFPSFLSSFLIIKKKLWRQEPMIDYDIADSAQLSPLRTANKSLWTGVALPRLLNWRTVSTELQWGIVILLGGGFALADGVNSSGLSAFLGEQLLVSDSYVEWDSFIVTAVEKYVSKK